MKFELLEMDASEAARALGPWVTEVHWQGWQPQPAGTQPRGDKFWAIREWRPIAGWVNWLCWQTWLEPVAVYDVRPHGRFYHYVMHRPELGIIQPARVWTTNWFMPLNLSIADVAGLTPSLLNWRAGQSVENARQLVEGIEVAGQPDAVVEAGKRDFWCWRGVAREPAPAPPWLQAQADDLATQDPED